MTEYYIEHRTMTKWIKVGGTFEPAGCWKINRDPKDVLDQGYFSGPYVGKETR